MNETFMPGASHLAAGPLVARRISGQQPLEVLAVGGLAELRDVGLEAGAVDPAFAESDFLKAGDFEALTILDDDRNAVSIAATAAQAVEGGVTGQFTVTRTGSTAAALTVRFSRLVPST